ncbi:MAG: hypothetical protein H6559_37835 [Lewinellaceae bacterium]|nr:hypothetical protein [Lewinellaceae bacterium]
MDKTTERAKAPAGKAMSGNYRPQTTKIPGSDRPASHYVALTAKAFLAYLADRAEDGLQYEEFYYQNLLHSFSEILDFLTQNLEADE